MTEQIINGKQSLEAYKKQLDDQFEKHKYLRVTVKTGKQRTLTQNAALHLYCQQLAEILNDGGYDFRAFIKDGVPVPFTQDLVKDHIWRPIQKAMTGKDSTVKPEKHEYSKIYDFLNDYLIRERDICLSWPSRENV